MHASHMHVNDVIVLVALVSQFDMVVWLSMHYVLVAI